MKAKRISFTPGSVVTIISLLLAVDLLCGAILGMNSRASTKALISSHMLGVAETAAALLDGDALAALAEQDVGGPRQQAVLDMLNFFRDHLDIKYIYAVRPRGDGTFIFIADTDPATPAFFGEEVVITPALVSAGKGKSAVDNAAVTDKWGKYYTAYCPVPASDGSVGGIVGVDFDADWYENWMMRNTVQLLLMCVISLLVGGGIVLLMTTRLRKRFNTLHLEMTSLASDLSSLTKEVTAGSGYTMTAAETNLLAESESELARGDAPADSVEKLAREVKTIKHDLKRYIAYVHEQAYIDSMTGVGSKAAYLELVHELDEKILAGQAQFSIAVFDVNGLKTVNDDYGHEIGDEMIIGAADCIKKVFGGKNVFRIGGDEFIAVLPDFTEEDMAAAFERLDREVARANVVLAEPGHAPVSFSRGAAVCRPVEDREFRQVFKRADQAMYQNKAAYYMAHGDRRKN